MMLNTRRSKPEQIPFPGLHLSKGGSVEFFQKEVKSCQKQSYFK